MILTAGSISRFGRNGNWHRSRVEASTDLLGTATGDIFKGPSSDPKVPPSGSKLVDIRTLRRRQPTWRLAFGDRSRYTAIDLESPPYSHSIINEPSKLLIRSGFNAPRQRFTVILTVNLSGTSIGAGLRAI
jgi:hypothetical protein